ncbi:hypothetical protein SSS_06158 [Sarcoptes scabiei]|uniref:Uncharacterized protein n=1 Tax=Sarcoptes scabiei TaxID=52283 RepID=A0A834VGJ5_SARSC|nr:hypothetical protein SSS_06158 [Sarcoptes scabiei]
MIEFNNEFALKRIRSKRSSYLIRQLKDIGYEQYDRKLFRKIASILIRIILFLLMTLILIYFDQFDWFDTFHETISFRRNNGQQYLLLTVCFVSIDFSLLFITYGNFRPLKKNMFILLPLTWMNWTINLSEPPLNHRNALNLIRDCDESVRRRIKSIIIFAELFGPIFLASLDLFTAIVSFYIIVFHLINQNRIIIILMDLIIFSMKMMNGRIFIDFANNNTVYISILRTYFEGNYKQINLDFHKAITASDYGKESKQIWRYLSRHNNLCNVLSKAHFTWSFGNFFTIIFNLPVNIILINIWLHYDLTVLKKILFMTITISHSLVMFNLIEVLHPIHRNAHGSKKLIAIFFAKNLNQSSSSSSSSIVAPLSLRLRIKLLNYFERLTSKQKQLGIGLGPGKPMNHLRQWELFFLYGSYFLNTYKIFQTKNFSLF